MMLYFMIIIDNELPKSTINVKLLLKINNSHWQLLAVMCIKE